MKRQKPCQITIYPGEELKRDLESLSKKMHRDLSSQCVAMLLECVERIGLEESKRIGTRNGSHDGCAIGV